MIKIEKDFHGLRLEQASAHMDSLLFQVLKTRKSHKLTLITGHGKIRSEVIDTLQEYEISWTFDNNNKGCIIAYIE